MDYMPDTTNQLFNFLYSAGLGFALGLLYDFFRILFILLTGSDKKLIMVRDIMYLFACLGCNFLFLLVMSDGEVLLYIAVGEVIGWSVYYFTLSDMIFLPIKRIIIATRRAIIKTYCKIRIIISKIRTKLQFFSKFYTKYKITFKKRLHFRQ